MSSRIVKGPGGSGESDGGGERTGIERRLDPGPGKVIKGEVASAQEVARSLREAAKVEAESLLGAARSDAERIRAEARRDGYAAGLAEWTEKVLHATRAERSRLERSREDLTRLALRIARKVLGREIDGDDATVGDLVLQAIRGLHHEGRIRVYLRPEDLERVQAQRGRIVEEIGNHAEIEFMQDAQIEGGGCRVETAYGIVDATLKTQLRVLEDALLGISKSK